MIRALVAAGERVEVAAVVDADVAGPFRVLGEATVAEVQPDVEGGVERIEGQRRRGLMYAEESGGGESHSGAPSVQVVGRTGPVSDNSPSG